MLPRKGEAIDRSNTLQMGRKIRLVKVPGPHEIKAQSWNVDPVGAQDHFVKLPAIPRDLLIGQVEDLLYQILYFRGPFCADPGSWGEGELDGGNASSASIECRPSMASSKVRIP